MRMISIDKAIELKKQVAAFRKEKVQMKPNFSTDEDGNITVSYNNDDKKEKRLAAMA